MELRKAALKGDITGATTAITTLHTNGATPDLIAFTHWMQAHAVRHDIDGALAVLEEMETRGLEPDLVPFSILLNLYAGRCWCVGVSMCVCVSVRLYMSRSICW